MLNYDEELKKFKPVLDVGDVEDSIYQKDMTDMVDILKELTQTDPDKNTENRE